MLTLHNKDEIVMSAQADDVIDKEKEDHMVDYIQSMKAIEDAMEPYKEQKRELKSEYIENGWLNKEDISLTVKAYRLLKDEVDISALIDVYESLKGAK
tara:strand:- start:446 stop:739 length:294 start_codon:yes stop_codon:yes gene_type:complete